MQDHDPHRRAVQYRLDRLAERELQDGAVPADDGAGTPEPAADRGAASRTRPTPASEAAPPLPRPPSMAARGSFADELVRQAMARGEFDDLPLAGKPIPGLTGRHDPDWWLKALIEREQITGVLPEALQLRKDDAVLRDRLDQERTEERVRELVEELNARVVAARRQLLGGPPVVTPLRDVEAEVVAWHERRRARQAEAAQREREASRSADAERRAAGRSHVRTGVLGRIRGRARREDGSPGARTRTGASDGGPAEAGTSSGDGA